MTFGFFYDALAVCIRRYNLANGTDYTKQDFVFDDPIDLREWTTPHPSKMNTLVKAKVGEATVEFVYDRVDLQVNYLKANTGGWPAIRLWKTCLGTKDTLAGPIQYFQGIPLEARDLVPEKFDPLAFNTDTTRTVSVKISSKSYNFLPHTTFVVAISGRYTIVDGKVCQVMTSGVEGPSQWTEDFTYGQQDIKTRGQAGLITWGTDYSKARRLLKRISGWHVYYDFNRLGNYSQGSRSYWAGNDLAKALSAIDGLPWVFDTSSVIGTANMGTHKPFNLYLSWPVYIGPTSGAKREKAMNYRVPTQYQHLLDAVNPEFDNVVILYLTTASNLASACVFLHFNDPEVS